MNGWDVEERTVKVRPGAVLDDGETPDTGERYRYSCNLCGQVGPWRRNGNDADGDSHLLQYHRPYER